MEKITSNKNFIALMIAITTIIMPANTSLNSITANAIIQIVGYTLTIILCIFTLTIIINDLKKTKKGIKVKSRCVHTLNISD